MKRLFFILLIFFCRATYGQSLFSSVYNLDHLPANFTGEWKFHSGDNRSWGDTSLDDHGWQHLDLTEQEHFLPEVEKAQVCWFRLTLHVAPKFRGKVVALVVNQYGAAEIYFNGDLIRKIGIVSANYDKEKTHNTFREPLTLKLTNSPIQFIAIRYSRNHSNWKVRYGNPVILASIQEVENAWESSSLVQFNSSLYSFVTGALLLLAVLQLAIYFFNRDRKVNLYLSLYAFLQLFTMIGTFLGIILSSYNWISLFQVLFFVSAGPAFFFLVLMTFEFLHYPINKNLFIILVILCITITIILLISGDKYIQSIVAVYNILCYAVIIRISIKAIKQNTVGSGFYLMGIIVSFTCFILFWISNYINWQPLLLFYFEITLAFTTPAFTLSVLLAREFAHNLITLQHRLVEVQTLSNRNLQQEIEKQQILTQQNETLEFRVNERTAALNNTIADLKATQTQLIQSEKMASLGELTAGIAHEIQNPLNFVNNFSEVNKELIEELELEIEKGDLNEIKALAIDLKTNEEKINHHGKRAEAIVKGMLEHSRVGSGIKEPTDINKLADEYLRLSYHGLRAKDKTFNAEMVTNFDEKLPLINVIPQDIGRVLLNLFNNAFYAVNQKAKTVGADYNPTVVVETFYLPHLEVGGLKVKDNGIGIPEHIKDKIMQPFFTTKPTGEGTGLGLSLTYDMVVKGHGGKIEVNSKDGEGSEFIVQLPIN